MTAVLLACLLSAPPRAEVTKGADLYYAGRFNRALRVLNRVLSTPDLPTDVRIEALKFKAFCQFVTRRRADAKRTWRELLVLRVGFVLDPMEASPELAEFFNAIEATKAHRTEPPEPVATEPVTTEPVTEPASPEPTSEPIDLEASAPVARNCAPWLCAIPFGVGQFVNRNYVRGSIFAGTQALFLSLNIGLYWTNRLELESTQRPSDAAETRHTLQHVFLGLFVASLAGGIVDAYLFP